MPSTNKNLRTSLLLLRLSIALVMLVWTFDKFMRPGHATGVFDNFYGIGGIDVTAMYVLAAAELLLIVLFLLGLFKTWTYGLVLLLHAGSTLSSFHQYLHPYTGANILFFAAWPMLAACIALFLLRRNDQLASL